MVMNNPHTRRKFIQKYLLLCSVALASGILLNSCNQTKSNGEDDKITKATDGCEDFSGVSENDMKAREKLGYVKESPMPDRTCSQCNLYLPPSGDKKCGGCMLFKGPVYSTAYCTYWTARQG